MIRHSSTLTSSGALARWARFAIHHRWQVLGGWVVGLVVLIVLATNLGGDYADDFTVPATESQRATDLLATRFPSQAGGSATLVVQSAAGVDDPAVRQRIEDLLTQAAALPEVVGVVSPYDNPAAISADRKIAYATVAYDKKASVVAAANVEQLLALVDRSSTADFRVEAGGQVVAQGEDAGLGSTELIGVGAAIVILLLAFGSVIAMGLPIVTALAGLLAGFMGITLAAVVLDTPAFTTSFAMMIGLGVGIDYALFVVTRYREGLATGLDVETAIVRAIDTAGRAVAFAGSVVAIALLGLLAIGIPFIGAVGVAAAVVVLFSVLVALTLLPALLGFVGRRVDRWRIPGWHADGEMIRPSIWYRWSRQIQTRPWPYLLGATGLLLLLTAPALDLRLGFADAGNNPTSTHTRRAYDLLAEGFGPGFNGPLILTVERVDGLDPARLASIAAALQQTAGVAAVAPAIVNPAGDTAVIAVVPTTSPQDAATPALLDRLRAEVLPRALAGSGTNAYVGGPTAMYVDVGERIAERMPLFFAIVIGLSVLLLAAVFRSLVVPLKAAVMNLLSIGAAYGVLVAVFQWGWAKAFFGVAKAGPVESFLPMMLFAVLFGLSMDYEVFLLSRIREEYLRTRRNDEAVAHGVASTARVITAAAAIMVCVFLSFVLGDERLIKEFGLGLAAALFIDATLVRLVLVPATMALLGDWNWWFPRWLDRLAPRLNVEGSVAPVPASLTGEAD